MEKIKVLITDDHILFGEGIRQLLESESDIECVAMAADGEEAVKLTKELLPDVVLLDIAMPKMDGIEAAKQIKESCPDTAVVIVSAYKYDHYILACMQAGVDAYLLKNTPRSDMINTIRMVHSGKVVFSLGAAGKIISRLVNDSVTVKSGIGGLQKRELQVLKLAASGLSNKQIASDLGISENTVATHFVNIFRKLRVESRTEATMYAFREGWITSEDLASIN